MKQPSSTRWTFGEGPVLQMLAQHARIRGLAMQLGDELEQDGVREDTLRNLGEQLEAHIRLEERRVFPFIEETLPEHALQEVASRLEVRLGVSGLTRHIAASLPAVMGSPHLLHARP